jgi:hypothetical protein
VLLLYHIIGILSIGTLHKVLRKKIVEIGYFAEIPAAANVGGRPIIAHSFGNVNRQNAQKKSAPLTAGGGQSNLELSFVVGEHELSFGIGYFVGFAHR